MGKKRHHLGSPQNRPPSPKDRREVLEVLQRIEHAPRGETDSEIRYLIRKENRLTELERRTRQNISEELADRIGQFRIAINKRVEAIKEGLHKEWSELLKLERDWGENEHAFLERKLEGFAKVREALISAELYEEAAKVREEERALEDRLLLDEDQAKSRSKPFPSFSDDLNETRRFVRDFFDPLPDPIPKRFFHLIAERYYFDAEIQRVELWVDPIQAEQFRVFPFEESQELIEEDEKGARFRYWIIPSDKFIRQVMMISDRMKLLEPRWMVDELKERLEKASAYYR